MTLYLTLVAEIGWTPPLAFCTKKRAKSGVLQPNFHYPSLKQFYTLSENYVTMAPTTYHLFLKAMSGQNGGSTYVGNNFASTRLQFLYHPS